MSRLGLRRKSGYISTYSLGSLWPAWKKGYFYNNSHKSPVVINVLGRWMRLPAFVIRVPSWASRVLSGTDDHGQVLRPLEPPRPLPWAKSESKRVSKIRSRVYEV